jgi:phage pi2 protein 07
MNTIPEFDDMADKDSYKLYKWMASRESFTIQDLKKKFKFRDSDSYTTILSGIAMMGYLGIKKSDIEYYSDEELTNISPEQMSTATIIPTPLILRYVQKRENEKYRWFASAASSAASAYSG